MSDEPICLDARRSAADRRRTDMRRRPMPPAEPPPRAGPGGEAMAEPAQSSAGGREGWRVLLARYAATPEAADARIRDLAGRIIDDMERLRDREERR